MRRSAVPAVASVFLLAACAHSGPQSFVIGPAPSESMAVPAGVSFAGTWTYDPDNSDQLGRNFGGSGMRGRGAMGGRGDFGGFGGEDESGGGGGGDLSGGGGGRRGGGEVMDSTLRRPARRLVIAQTDSSLTISPRDSVQYTLYFDGRNVAAPDLLGGTAVGLSGHWHKKQFDVIRQMPSGATITESYQVTHHGERLVIHVEISRGSDRQVMPEFDIVYDRYQQAAGGGSGSE